MNKPLKSNINSLGNDMAGVSCKYLLQRGRLEMPSKPSGKFRVESDGSLEGSPLLPAIRGVQALCISVPNDKQASLMQGEGMKNGGDRQGEEVGS